MRLLKYWPSIRRMAKATRKSMRKSAVKRSTKRKSMKRSAKTIRILRARGGGLGQSYAFTGESVMTGLGNAVVNQPVSSCVATPRVGEVSVAVTGIPGQFAQAGGRYGFDLTQQVAPATPFLGGIPPVVRIPCETQYSNPLNPGSMAPIQPNLPQLGGANPADTAALFVPTAGYTQSPSTWVGSTGAPALLSIPYEARGTPSMTPACLMTGGAGRRKTVNKRNKRK